MAGQRGVVAALILAAQIIAGGCSERLAPPPETIDPWNSRPFIVVPPDVRRMAIVYPRALNRDFIDAYYRLEGGAFQLKAYRPALKIVDRAHFSALMTELQFQSRGVVREDSALRIGQMLGADSVLLYQIEGPTLGERSMATRPSQLRPIVVTTKIIRVESAEVVYHDVVIAGFNDRNADRTDYPGFSRDALERGLSKTLANLHQAFQ